MLLIPPQAPVGLPSAILLLGLSMGLLDSPFYGGLLGHILNRHHPQPELGLAVGWLFFLHNEMIITLNKHFVVLCYIMLPI